MRDFVITLVARLIDPRNIAIWFLATSLMANVGPFGTLQSFPLAERFMFWGAIMGWALIVAAIVMTIVPEIPLLETHLSQETFGPVFFTLLFAPTLWLGLVFVYGAPASEVPSIGALALTSFLVAAIVCIVRYVLVLNMAHTVVAEETVRPEPPRLQARLPVGDPSPILRISARDHHVTVVTAMGTYELRMRFSDAIAEMDSVEGCLTHRSHWVARAGIRALEHTNGKAFVVSQDEERVPVSRKHLRVVEEFVST